MKLKIMKIVICGGGGDLLVEGFNLEKNVEADHGSDQGADDIQLDQAGNERN